MYVTPYTYHGATSVRLGTHGLRLDPRAAQHPQPAGWAAAHCEHPRARAQQQNPGPKPEARAAAGPRPGRGDIYSANQGRVSAAAPGRP